MPSREDAAERCDAEEKRQGQLQHHCRCRGQQAAAGAHGRLGPSFDREVLAPPREPLVQKVELEESHPEKHHAEHVQPELPLGGQVLSGGLRAHVGVGVGGLASARCFLGPAGWSRCGTLKAHRAPGLWGGGGVRKGECPPLVDPGAAPCGGKSRGHLGRRPCCTCTA